MGERVRFSPSPSGPLHLGGARTALFNHLVARRTGGTFVLRFEDTDAARARREFEQAIAADLAWLGVVWDEGPDIGGPAAPYRQSERGAVYADALARLVTAGAVYPCFCGAEELAAERAADAEEERAPRYRGECRNLTPGETAERIASGEPHCFRFAVEPAGEVVVRDRVHGDVRFARAGIGDFVVARASGEAVYDLACVVDDAAMGITFVIRGDDHLSNTARQLLLFEALGWSAPHYAHVPLVLGGDGRPLAKSRGAEPVSALRDAGYLPGAVVNHLALLGWSDPQGREVLSATDLLASFDLARVSPSSPVHDAARLRWLNGRHMAALPAKARDAAIEEHLSGLPAGLRAEAARLLAGEVEVAGDAERLVAGVVESLPPDEEAEAALSVPVAAAALATAARALRDAANGDPIRAAFKGAGLPPREAMPAVRAALTGRAHGLPVATLVRLIGREAAASRLEAALRA